LNQKKYRFKIKPRAVETNFINNKKNSLLFIKSCFLIVALYSKWKVVPNAPQVWNVFILAHLAMGVPLTVPGERPCDDPQTTTQ